MPAKTTPDTKALSAHTRRLLNREEGQEIDFKRSPDGVKPEDYVALANAGGGTILVGIEEVVSPQGLQSGKVVGCSVSEKTKRALVSIAASCKPAITIHIHRESTSTKKPIFRIDVPEGPEKPYCTGSGTYKIRADGQNVALDPQLLRAMILQAEADEFVARFRLAADELIGQLQAVHRDLAGQIAQVEAVAAEAIDAARDAESAAMEAAEWTQA